MAEPKPKPKPKPKPTLVIGTNLGHARRTCERLGLPRSQAIAIDKAHDHIKPDTEIVLARPEADRSAEWARIEETAKKHGIETKTDTGP